jgi:sigma-B regulation protein RsbU (phosphoserine phosphatase)
LLLYTDGVTEAEDIEKREFGEKRLIEVLAQAKGATPTEAIAEVEDAVREFSRGQPQFDDITCVAIAR